MSDYTNLQDRLQEHKRKIDRDWRIFVTLMVAAILFIVGFGIFAAAGGMGPTKSERISRLEQQVAEIQKQLKEEKR